MKSKSKSYKNTSKKKPITKVVEQAFKNIEKQFIEPSKPKTKVVEEPHCSCCEAGCTCCSHPSGRTDGCLCRCNETMH